MLSVMHTNVDPWHILPLFICKVPLQCKVKRLAGAAAAGPKGRGKGRPRVGYMNFLKKKGMAEKVIVHKKWPVFLLPSNFASGMAAAGADQWMMLGCEIVYVIAIKSFTCSAVSI